MKLRILMVEDDELLQEAYRRFLKRRGHTVTVAGTVLEGRARLADKPDVLLLDRQVLGGDGWSLRHEAAPGCRVVLMTGHGPPDSPPHWQKSGNLNELYALIEG
jgi:DNA-binding response OmpR family regulator